MSPPPMTPCIQPNPEVSGIGVRVSIYAQALLILLRLFIIARDGKITIEEKLAIKDILATNELTACALLVSAIIQARTYGLSAYHANIVLVLSWITFVPTILTVFLWENLNKTLTDGDTIEPEAERIPSATEELGGIGVFAIWMHYCAVAGLGLWVWSDVDSFGNEAQCTPQTFVVIFGHNVLVTNHKLKIAALFLYAFWGSFAVLAVIAPFIVGISMCLQCLSTSPTSRPTSPNSQPTSLNPRTRNISLTRLIKRRIRANHGLLTIFFLEVLGIEVFFIASTEILITRSKGLVFPGESQWTFGQSLAVFLVIIPVVSILRELREGSYERREKAKKRGSRRFQGSPSLQAADNPDTA